MKKILSAIILLLLLVVGGLWWYIRSSSGTSVGAPTASSSPTVPFPVATDRPISVIQGPGSASSSSFAQNGPSSDGGEPSDGESYDLYSRPVVGYHFITIATSTALILMDRDSGNLYVVGGESGTQVARVSNTTLLGVEKAWWVESKDKLYTIVSSREEGLPATTVYSVKKSDILSSFTSSSSPVALIKEGIIDAPVIDIAPAPTAKGGAPTGNKFLLLSHAVSGGTKLEVVDASTLKRTTLSTSLPLTELLPVWNSAKTAALTTKVSFSTPGTLFGLDISTGALTRLLGATSNFSSLSDTTLSNILYTDGSQSKIKSTRATSTQILSLSAIPEKCVWSSMFKGLLYCAIPHDQGEFLLQHDAWLRGEYSTHDDLWWIDTRSGSADKLMAFSQALDASQLTLNPTETELILKNRVTGALLSIPIPQETSD